MYAPLLSNKTAQRNSQHCTKVRNEVHNKVHNMLHSKIYQKIKFSLCSGFAKQAKINLHPQLSIQAISRELF